MLGQRGSFQILQPVQASLEYERVEELRASDKEGN